MRKGKKRALTNLLIPPTILIDRSSIPFSLHCRTTYSFISILASLLSGLSHPQLSNSPPSTMSAPIMIHHFVLSPKPFHAFSRTPWSWTFKCWHALRVTLGVSDKIAGADESLGAPRAGNLGLNFCGENGRGWDGRL